MNKARLVAMFGMMFIAFMQMQGFAQSSAMLSPEIFGGKADAAVINSANVATNSKILTCRAGKFTVSDTGKIIFVNGAGMAGGTFVSTIDSVFNKDSIALKYPAYMAVSGTIVTYGTDCTDAFVKINAAAREIKDKMVHIKFETGTYLTKFNNWLAGIKDVEIKGNGASIMCTNGAYNQNGNPAANVSLFMPTVFDNVDNDYYSGKWLGKISYGYRINSASLGDTKIMVQVADSAANFKAGDWALIYGFEQENVGGYPPDARYFEYIKVKKVDADKGLITFSSSLQNNYDSGWPDSTWTGGTKGIGAPRIINCNRQSFNIIDNLVINDLNLVAFPGWTGKFATAIRNGRFQLYGAINANITNMNMSGLYIGTSRNVRFKKCVVSQECEPDKEVENLVFDDCTIHKIVGARGIDTLKLLNSKMEGEFTLSPRVLDMDRCTFTTYASGSTSSLAHIGFNGGTEFIRLGNNTWNCNDEKRSYIFGPGGVTNLKVEKILDDNTVLVSNSNWSDARNGRQVVPGHIGYTTTGNMFTVSRVYQNAPGEIAIKGDFSAPPVVGDVFTFYFIPKLSVEGKQTLVGPYKDKYTFFADATRLKNVEYHDR